MTPPLIDVAAPQPSPITGIAAQTDVRRRTATAARPWLSVTLLLVSDLAALSIAAVASVLVWPHIGMAISAEFYLRLSPVLLLFPVAYAASGLYPGFGRNPADELRKLCAATSVVYPALAVTIFLLKDAPTYSRGVFVLAWLGTIVFVPLLRAMLRESCARKPWWGYAVAVAAPNPMGERIAEMLDRQPVLGLKPVAVFENPQLAIPLARSRIVRHVILGMTQTSREATLRFLDQSSELFSDVIVIPDLAGFSSLWVEARDLNGMLGLAVRPRLLLPGSRIVKRSLDLGLILLASPVLLPLMAVLAVLIKLTSAGPVFYGQQRYGRAGLSFTAWKFRSMVSSASDGLERCLASDPDLRDEWSRFQKLRHDPRITPMGRFLRRTSMDELPQVWNILRGQMSLVGPRPILGEGIPRYGEGYGLYKKVTPGLTGMWQVSGRNNLSYEQRVEFDLYYVRNWSVWLDLYILARTVKVVAIGDGAY